MRSSASTASSLRRSVSQALTFRLRNEGVAQRRLGPSGTATIGRIYKYGYAPEFFSGVASVESDIYQVGLTLYRMLNGDQHFKQQHPPDVATLKDRILRGQFPDRDAFLPHVPGWVRTCVRKALKVDPADRHRTAVDFSTALSNVTVNYDWEVLIEPDGSTSWTACPNGRAPVEARLISRGGLWDVEVHTRTATGTRRAKNKTGLWRNSLSRADAEKHLKTAVFEPLG